MLRRTTFLVVFYLRSNVSVILGGTPKLGLLVSLEMHLSGHFYFSVKMWSGMGLKFVFGKIFSLAIHLFNLFSLKFIYLH